MPSTERRPAAAMPRDLEEQVAAFTGFFRSDDDGGLPTAVPHPAADEWLRRERERFAKPATREDCHDWLIELCCGVNGIDEETFKLREHAIWKRCRDLPACVWCDETLNRMWDRTSFLPSPGECREVLTAYLLPLQQEIRALERIVRAGQRERPKPVTSEPYVLPRPPEWALAGPTHQGPRRDFAAEFQAKHGREPGSLDAAVLAAVRAAAAARAKGSTGGPSSSEPSEPSD